MTCYITDWGGIKLDGYLVGRVYPKPPSDAYPDTLWVWTARVNGRRLGLGDFWLDRLGAFDCAKRECEREASVIR